MLIEKLFSRTKDLNVAEVKNIFPKLQDKRIHTLVITDTHDTLTPYDFPETTEQYDILICLGDIGWSDWMTLFAKEEYLQIPVKIGVVGNHDSKDFSKINQWLKAHNSKEIMDIHNTIYTVPEYNITFAGIKSSIKYKSGGYLLTQKEVYDISENLKNVDILLTHSNPKERYDTDDGMSQNAHDGFYGITNYMRKHECFYNIHGHVHSDYIKLHYAGLKRSFIEISLYKVKELNITENGIEL